MNHRELVLSAGKKARFEFLALPESLQDEIVEGLDGRTLTLEGAAALVKSSGYRLSHVAIGGYYRAVRRERRLLELSSEVKRIVSEFAGQPYEESLKSLANLIIATAAVGLADGSVGIKDIDLGKVLKALPAPADKTQPDREASANDPKGLNPDVIKKVREQIYGIV